MYALQITPSACEAHISNYYCYNNINIITIIFVVDLPIVFTITIASSVSAHIWLIITRGILLYKLHTHTHTADQFLEKLNKETINHFPQEDDKC